LVAGRFAGVPPSARRRAAAAGSVLPANCSPRFDAARFFLSVLRRWAGVSSAHAAFGR
jgi:hypothetical protein